MGGKRKKSNNGPVKKESKYKIPSRFDCPLCDSKATIIVKVVRSQGEATVHCRVCGAGKEKRWAILPLEKPVDVFFRFHEALLQKDQADLRKIESSREAVQARLNAGAAPVAVADPSWVGEDGAGGSRATTPSPTPVPPPAAASSTSRPVRTLGDLQRKLAGSYTAYDTADARAIELGDDYAGEAEGMAEHYFAPRVEVHSDGDDDGYDKLFESASGWEG